MLFKSPEVTASHSSGSSSSLLPQVTKEEVLSLPAEYHWMTMKVDHLRGDVVKQSRSNAGHSLVSIEEEEDAECLQSPMPSPRPHCEELKSDWVTIEVEGKLFPDPFPNSAYWLHQDNFEVRDKDTPTPHMQLRFFFI